MIQKEIRIKDLLQESALCLREVTDIPQKEAMMLLAESLGKEMSWLIGHGDDYIKAEGAFEENIKRRSLHEPLEYILGRAMFYGTFFEVDSRVLIPRPETELLVDHAVKLAKDFPHSHIVEIGCGSGVVSVMLALLLPHAKITAVDISEDALHVSQKNAKMHGVSDRIRFVHGSYLDSVTEKIDMIVSNPPYIANQEPLAIGLSYEPSLALYGGSRGDEMLCHIMELFMKRKAKVLVCEMGYDQKKPLEEHARKIGLSAHFYEDLAGLDRGFWIKD